MKVNKERYLQKVTDTYGGKVEILSEFLGKERPITICYHCDEHGDTVKTMVAKNVFNANFSPCKQCSSLRRSASLSKGQSMSKQELFDRLSEYCESRGGSVLETEWMTSKSVYHFKCNNPEHPPFTSTADSLLSGNHWCPRCSGRVSDFKGKYEKIVKELGGEIIVGYRKGNIPMRVKCIKHNYEWDILPSNLNKRRWCPICNLGDSEKVVWDWYHDHNIKCDAQYTFENFVGEDNNAYRFDFAVFDNDDSLKYLLEIDDETHRGSSDKYARVRRSDALKDKYCEDNNIQLFRIPISYSKLRKYGVECYAREMDEKLSDLEGLDGIR